NVVGWLRFIPASVALGRSPSRRDREQRSSPSDIRIAAGVLFRKPPPERSHRILHLPHTVRALLILGFFCMITIRDSPRPEFSASLKCGFMKQAPSTGIAVPSQMDS